MKRIEKKLPDTFKSILWSYDFEKVEPEKMKKTIVFQTLKYGTMAEWYWIRNAFGEEEIKNILRKAPLGQFEEKNKNLISFFIQGVKLTFLHFAKENMAMSSTTVFFLNNFCIPMI